MKALSIEQNFLGIEEEFSNTETARVVILSCPFEATSTVGRGSSDGPEAILEASRHVELFDADLGFEPYRTCGIVTLPALDVEGHTGGSLKDALCAAVEPWVADARFVITLGGEHTSIVGAVEAYCRHYDDLTVLHFDAHSDLRPEFEDNEWSHACALRRVLDFHKDIVQVGIRSQDMTDREAIAEYGIPVFYAHQIYRSQEAREDWVGKVIAACRKRVYISFDCDVFDPSIIPATGTPEPGGLNWYQIDALLERLCHEREVVGMDVTELMPISGQVMSEFTIARVIYRLLGYRFPEPQD